MKVGEQARKGTEADLGHGATPPRSTVIGRASFEVPRAVSPRPVPEDAPLSHAHLLFNRELSWMDFNWRVLAQASLPWVPLLERVRFLSIAESNLNEFIRKRMGGLKRQREAGVTALSADGRSPGEQIQLLQDAVVRMQERMIELWSDELCPLLEETGIEVLGYDELTDIERRRLHQLFQESIYPILTPLAVDPGHPFPFISNLSLSLAIVLRHPTRQTRHFARLKIPTSRSRWVPVDDSGRRFLPLEALIARHTDELFRGLELVSAHAFRVTRNADITRDEDETEDLIQMISEELRERRVAPVVRLEVDQAMPDHVRELLCRELDMEPHEVVELDGLLGLVDLAQLADLEMPDHRFTSWEPQTPAALAHEGETEETPDIFSVIRSGDVLVHHPYESFTGSVQHFLEAAALDPDVVAIKQTLYRTGEHSPVVRALIRAADQGKQVAALVEITARFDEESNIEWAHMLESHGVHVTYGLVGLKTHAKVMLVVREEGDGIRTYCHIGTGNYHARTARLYSDLGLLTADPVIGYDVIDLFHYITGHSPDQQYDRLIVAPRNMRPRFHELIEREIGHAEAGRGGRIVAKMNALDDLTVIQLLYRASRAGVQVDLIVRGHCRLRPGVPGFSENIRVFSIIGRFLEHDRIFRFDNAGSPQIFIGSADWRRRNLEERVEAVVQVDDPALVERLCAILDTALEDNATAWDLHSDGHYALRTPAEDEARRGYHEMLMQGAVERSRAAALRPMEVPGTDAAVVERSSTG